MSQSPYPSTPPMPGHGYPPPPPAPRNGLGTTALVLGILAILLAFVPILGLAAWPLAILGIIFGLVSVRRVGRRVATNRGASVAGLITSILGLVLVIASTVIYTSAINAAVNANSNGAASGTGGTTGSPCAASYPDKQPSDVCADPNGTVVLSGMSVTATPLAVEHDATLGTTGLCSTITLANTSPQTQDYNVLDFKLQSPTGDVATASLMGAGQSLDSGALITGGKKTGKVCSDSNAAAGNYVLIYKPNAFEATRGVWLFKI